MYTQFILDHLLLYTLILTILETHFKRNIHVGTINRLTLCLIIHCNSSYFLSFSRLDKFAFKISPLKTYLGWKSDIQFFKKTIFVPNQIFKSMFSISS